MLFANDIFDPNFRHLESSLARVIQLIDGRLFTEYHEHLCDLAYRYTVDAIHFSSYIYLL